mgnify:CR=1 FL=1
MDPSDTYQIIILLILLALSAFFSSNETALMSVNRIRLRSLADEGNKRASMALDILEDQMPKLLSAILIGNNIVNISASSLATTLAYSFWRIYGQHRDIDPYCPDPDLRRDHPKELRNHKRGKDHSPLYPDF